MRKVVDARGLSCPQPVVLTKQALDNKEINEVLTIVDNLTAVENVSRMVKTLKLGSVVDEKEGNYYINITKEGIMENDPGENLGANTVVLISSNVLGRGDDNLGAMLMKSFMYTLTQMQGEIRTMLFMNSGVLVTTGGSELIEHIKLLENHGVEILSCGTCLDFYHMTDKLMVGSVTNMYTIAEKLMHADRVITF